MSYGRFVQTDRAERMAEKQRITREQAEKRDWARALVRDRMPDLVDDRGEPCDFAVFAALTLRARPPTARSASPIRRYRAGHLTRIEDRHKTPTTAPAKTAAAPDSMESLAA
jgi:hypothetical protein